MYSAEKEVRAQGEALAKAWEKADTAILASIILPDALVDFDIFEAGINRDELMEKLAERPRKIAYVRFEILNHVVVMGEEKAKQTYALLGHYADPNDGVWTRYSFEGMVSLVHVKTANGWKISSVKFMLIDDIGMLWSRLTNDGIRQEKGKGDLSFVSNWSMPYHDDRIGWFPGRRLPVINGIYDNAWYGMEDRIPPEREEDLVEEAFWKYSFGIDENNFDLYRDCFTEDCRVIYGDSQPFTLRGVIDFLKLERQGSTRCVHTGYFKDVTINGNEAIGHLYLVQSNYPNIPAITPENLDKRHSWARYTLRFRKEKGRWKISQLNFYMGFTIQER